MPTPFSFRKCGAVSKGLEKLNSLNSLNSLERLNSLEKGASLYSEEKKKKN
jgi:hypothetical protein